MHAIEKLIQDLRDTRNSLDKVAELLENLGKIPLVLQQQEQILKLLQDGNSQEFRSKLIGIVEQLESLGE